MREITEFDDRRHAEITLTLNDDDQIIAVSVYFCSPKLLHDFAFIKIGQVGGCGGCSDKGQPRNPMINIPNQNQTPCGGNKNG